MASVAPGKMFRIYGDDAVLSRLERLGAAPRTMENLISIGFPPQQLEEARHWLIDGAVSHVQQYAAARLKDGYFEDESLLEILCRFFQCTDWKLESSPWFFSVDDYRKFNQALKEPLLYYVHQTEAGLGEERWGHFFQKLPFDLGMERALRSLWEEICTREYYWKPQKNYLHQRAAQLLQYLERTVDIQRFSEHQFHYNWERRFRRSFKPVLDEFQDGLERAVRKWQESRREKTDRFTYGTYMAGVGTATGDLLLAMKYFGLEPATACMKDLRNSYRRLSKAHHPDQGGNADDFRRLSAYKDLIENWLRERHPA